MLSHFERHDKILDIVRLNQDITWARFFSQNCDSNVRLRVSVGDIFNVRWMTEVSTFLSVFFSVLSHSISV